MKKNIYALCIFYLIALVNVPAQTIKWGETIASHKQYFCVDKHLGEYGDNVFLVMRYGSNVTMEHRLQVISKKTLSIVKDYELTGKVGKSTLDYFDGWMIDNRIFITYQASKSNYLVQEYDTSLNPVGNLKDTEDIRFQSKPITSSDKSKNLFLETKNKMIIASWYNKNISEKINKQEFKHPSLSSENVAVFHEKTMLGDDDAIYGLVKKCIVNPKSKNISFHNKEGSTFSYEIYCLKKDGGVEVKNIKVQAKFTGDATAFIQKNGNIGVVGFSSNSKSTDATDFFVWLFDKDLNVIKKYEKPFDANFISSFNKKGNSIKNLCMRKVHIQEDGGVFIVAESSIGKTETNMNNTSSQERIEEDDIICIKLSEDLSFKFIKQIGKHQVEIVGNTLHNLTIYSIIHFSDGNKIGIIYQDHVANKDMIEGVYKKGTATQRSLFLVEITNDGKITKKMLYEDHPKNHYVAVPVSKQLEGNNVILFAYGTREFSWGILKI